MAKSQTRRRFLGSATLAAPALLLGSRERRPNILWLMTDEQRPDSLGCYGSRWAHTPVLDQLAREGVLFESAYTPSPVCVPARCALLTGNYGSTLGVLHNQQKLPPAAHFLTWDFENGGYQTASFGKKHYFYPGPRQAFQTEAGMATEGIVEPEGYSEAYDPQAFDVVQYPNLPARKLRRRWILAGKFPAARHHTAEAQNVDLAIQWLARRDRRQPFLLRLSLNAPHTPVVVPPEFLLLIDPDKIDLPVPDPEELEGKPDRERIHLLDFQGAFCFTPAEIRKIRHYYYARAAFVDAEIGRLVEWMERHGMLQNTIVAFVSDHGTHLGDHGLVQKQTFYEQVVTVPYLIWWPGRLRPVRISRPVSTITFLPTLAELAGVKLPRPPEGTSLARYLVNGQQPPAKPVFSELKFGYQGYRDNDRQVMVREGRWKLSLFIDGRPDGSLYDLAADPEERFNQFETCTTTATELRGIIETWDNNRHRQSLRQSSRAASR